MHCRCHGHAADLKHRLASISVRRLGQSLAKGNLEQLTTAMRLLGTLMHWLIVSSVVLTILYLYSSSFASFSSGPSTISLPINQPGGQKSESIHDPSTVAAAAAAEFTNVDAYVRYMTSHLALKPVVDYTALKPEFGSVINDVEFRYAINLPMDHCLNVHLFIIVISAPGNFVHRQVVRQTWASHLTKSHQLEWSAKFAFLIGLTNDSHVQNAIGNESVTHRDLIQVNVVDTYMNLTLKTVAMLHWSLHFCPHAQLIFKCDDDVYLNVPYLVTLTSRLSLDNITIYGSAVANLNPTRPRRDSSLSVPVDDDDKWAVSWPSWPWSTYPTYISGGCYLIDSDAIGPLLAAAQTTPYFPFEDIYLSGLCARKAGVQVLASDRMLGAIFNVVEDVLDEDGGLMKNHVAWLTSSADEMIASHFATEFYFSCDGGTGDDQTELQIPQFNWSHI